MRGMSLADGFVPPMTLPIQDFAQQARRPITVHGDSAGKIPHRGNVRGKCEAAVLLMLPQRRQGQGQGH